MRKIVVEPEIKKDKMKPNIRFKIPTEGKIVSFGVGDEVSLSLRENVIERATGNEIKQIDSDDERFLKIFENSSFVLNFVKSFNCDSRVWIS